MLLIPFSVYSGNNRKHVIIVKMQIRLNTATVNCHIVLMKAFLFYQQPTEKIITANWGKRDANINLYIIKCLKMEHDNFS